MKSIIIMASVIAALTFFGCSGNDGALFEGDSKTVSLNIGEEMLVSEGDKLQAGEDTVINVIHEVDNPIKKVTLLSGTAELIRGDYEITN